MYISDVAVRHTHRRLGIATALLRHAVGEAQRLAIGSVCLYVSASNPAAIDLYQHNGYLIVGKRLSMFGWLVLGNRQWHLMRKMIPRTAPTPFATSSERTNPPSHLVE
jgi:ribosomal protein S18 acetylase RimI-like enzyme